MEWRSCRTSVLHLVIYLLTSCAPTMAGTYTALQRPTELQYWDATRADNGYNFFGVHGTTYLLDMEGRVVHTWPIGTNPHLLSNGAVLDAVTDDPSGFGGFKEVSWEGATAWSYLESRSTYHPHHDFTRIYNPKLKAYTTLYIANKDLTYAQLIAAGADPARTPSTGAQMDAIVEVDSTGTIEWEWCFFDHLVQDFDATKANHVGSGKTIADFPGRLNINLAGHNLKADWLHCNSLDYNQSLDQIVVNSVQGEFYVIDHGNTFLAGNPSDSVALAATPAGDFLYRFGDPARYEQGTKPSVLEDWTQSTTGTKQLGGAHDIQWIGEGLTGAGHFLVFNNAEYLSEHTSQSYVMEINPYLDASGNDTGHYVNPPAAGYNTVTPLAVTDKAPKQISKQVVWNYTSKSNLTLYSQIGCSAQRLPNGNTLICADTQGYVMEVTPTGETVWDYIVPVTSGGIVLTLGDRLPMVNSIFRAFRYRASNPALTGRTLTAGATIAGRTTVANPYAGTSGYTALQRPTQTQYWDTMNAYNGYTFFAAQGTSYLIDMQGRVAHKWATGTDPRLLDTGHVLDWASGYTGLKELDWNGATVWQYTESRSAYHPHGDFQRIYDQKLGTYATLYLANKDVTAAECIAAGCDPADAPYTGAQVDTIVEVDMSGTVVWEWSFWDHAIQNVDATKANTVATGKTIADYPGRINLNLPGRPLRANWMDCNSLDFNQSLNQIVVNSRQGELYVIDHGNTFLVGNPAGSIALAATSAGDFLYRFGDPARYNQGSAPSVGVNWETATSGTKQIGGSANAQWISTGLPGAGHLLVFDNNQYLYQRTPQSYVFEINPYLNSSGVNTGAYVNPPTAGYNTWTFDKDTMKANQALSKQVVWTYGSDSNLTLFSHFGSSAQRLPNGNTLICATTEGYLVEVDASGNVVWEYINPVTNTGIVTAIGDRLPMTNAVPRAMRFASTFAGFTGHDLTPGPTITDASRPYTMAALPDTGQAAKYASSFGEDADYTINSPAYTDNGDGTVTDKVTGLVWQKADGGEMTWEQAAAYADNLSLGGATDWRLPFAKELFSVLHEGTLNPAMNTTYFPASAADYWWSSDVAVDNAAKVWVTNAGGGIGPHLKTETISAGGSRRFNVRCVRDPLATGATHLYGSLTDNGDGTVTDNHTGLVWQQGEVTATTWEGAIAYAEGLTLAGKSDWRLPNIKELQSISDLDVRAPSMDRVAFPGATTTRYWSSTTMMGDKTQAWYLDTDYGLTSYDAKTSQWHVRCVRGGSTANLNAPEIQAVPAGTFVMGDHFNFTDPDHPSDELPLHTVSLDAFSIGTYDITNRQYCAYLNAALAQGLIEVRNGLVYAPGGSIIYCETRAGEPALFGIAYSGISWDGTAFSVLSGRENHPMVGVRWEGAAAYCNWLSTVQGYTPCYNLTTWACNFAAGGYRLPTEAEWEYAANGGHTNPYYQFPWGSNTNSDGKWSNWENSGDPYETGDFPWTTPVGFYNGGLHLKSDFGWPGSQVTYQTSNAVNGFGLYDMGGNVWQWINDWYGKDYYAASPTSNPTGPAAGDPMPDGKAYHGMRGGNWYNGQQYLGMSRISNRDPGYYRGPQDPNHPYYHVGFRVALKTSTTTNTAPVISNTTRTPAAPSATDVVWVTSRITDDGGVASATLTYATGIGTGTTSTVFTETMCATAVKPWTGSGAQNAWTVTGNTFEQRTGSNYGTGNACGLEFKSGANLNALTAAMIATTNSITTAGTSGYVEFWLQSLTLDGTDGWTFQVDAGSGFVTRLSELTGSSHGWQKYHYDLASGELTGSIKMRFQFTGGGTGDDDRIDLDQITVTVTSGSLPVAVTMADDGAHGDGAAGDHVYGGQIPAMAVGTAVSYYVTAADADGLTTSDPATAPAAKYSYIVGHTTPVLKINEILTDSTKFIATADCPTQTVGLSINTDQAMPGYTLLDPMHAKTTYLLNNAGQVVHTWTSAYEPGRTAYLMPNGHLFRACMAPGGMSTGGGEGGRIEERDWDGNLVWFLNYAGSDYMMHHDFKVLPNGNILMIVVEKMPYADVIAAGFNPALLDSTVSTDGYLLPDSLVEVKPTAPSGGTVVWQWHVKDHLVQDYSSSKANYGVVAQHPELIDANGPGTKIPQFWNHINGIDYNAALDQVMLSARNQNEVWVIDHGTTTAQAAGHTDGTRGHGGDLIYRWGDPQMYDAGTSSNRMLFQQHNTQWIPSDCPGAGDILFFNNGLGRPAGAYSTIDEFTPPLDGAGNYIRTAGSAYGPAALTWTYVAAPPTGFYSAEISGTQRLPNGNTLVCEGLTGRIFEVTPAGQTVWQYQNPVYDQGVLGQGSSLPADPRGGYMTAVFRAQKYPLTYAAFTGRTLTPSGPVEQYPDWIEIRNPGASAIDMAGMYLTNDLTAPTKWRIPTGVSIPAYGYLLFWADGQTAAGSRHTSFTLNTAGGALGLYDIDGTTKVDSISYGAQITDVSSGRYPDAADVWVALTTPTPGAPNGSISFGLPALTSCLRWAAGLAAVPPAYFSRFDVVANGRIDLADATRIARKVAGLEPNP